MMLSVGEICSGIVILFLFSNRKLIFSKRILEWSTFVRIFIEDVGLTLFGTFCLLSVGFPYSLSIIFKWCLWIYMKVKHGVLGDTIDCLDVIGLMEDNNTPLIITSLNVIQGPTDLNQLRNQVLLTATKKTERGSYAFPKFQQNLVQVCGYSCWVPATFDIDAHVRFFDNCDENTPSMSDNEVLKATGPVSKREFQAGRSPWEVLLIPKFHYVTEEGAESKGTKSAILIRIHHAIGDGYSLLKLLIRDTNVGGPATAVPRAPSPPHMPLWKGALVFLYLTLRASRAFYVELLTEDRNPLRKSAKRGRGLSGEPVLVWSPPISIDFLKNIKRAAGVSLSSAFLAGLVSSIHKYMEEEFNEGPRSLSALTPFPAPNHPDNKMTNKFSFIRHPLPVGEVNPYTLLTLVNAESRKITRAPDGPMNLIMLRLMGVLPTRLIRLFLKNRHSTLVVSNLPGPSNGISIWRHELLETMFWLPPCESSGISASFLSYKSHFRLGMTVDTGLITGGREGALKLVDGFTKAISEMAENAQISIPRTFPPEIMMDNTGRLSRRSSSVDSESDSVGSEAETSGHYSFTSTDNEGGSDREEMHRVKKQNLESNFGKGLRKRSLSSSSLLERRIEDPRLLRCNSANSNLYHRHWVQKLDSKSRLCSNESLGTRWKN